MTKRNLRGKGLFQLGKLGQMLKVGIFSLLDLKQRQWRDASYWLAFPDLLNLLPIQPRTTCLKAEPLPTVG